MKLLLKIDRRGFTLIELMVALAIGSVIVIGIYATYNGQRRINQTQDQIVEIQQNLRAGLDMMSRELKMAGFDPDGTEDVGFTAATATSVTFTMRADGDGRDNDGDGERDELDEYTGPGAATLVSYSFQDAYGDGDRDGDGVATCGNGVDVCDLVREVVDLDKIGTPIALIENVENVEFYYILTNGESRLKPRDEELTEIRSVKISVLARSSGVSLNYIDTNLYFPASSANMGTTWRPLPPPKHDDEDARQFRRRMQIITVECRNL